MITDRFLIFCKPVLGEAQSQAAAICDKYYSEFHPENLKGIQEFLAEYPFDSDPDLEAWLEREMHNAKPRYRNRCKVHGFDHAFRVTLHTYFLTRMLGLAERDTRILLFTALNHDIGREDDTADPYHGFRGAAAVADLCEQFSEEETFLIRAVIAAHSFKDKDAGDILNFFGTADDGLKERYRFYLGIVKDADALDRFRLSNRSLDPRFLRLPQSAGLILAACELVQIFYTGRKDAPNTRTILWDEVAGYYGLVSELAYSYAKDQLEAAGVEAGSTLLDVGAGCGRYSIAAASICSHVTALDQSANMLAYCREWAGRWNCGNVDTVNCDWNDMDKVAKLGKFDHVLASRTGTQDVIRLSSIAKKSVILIDWANAPSFPDLTVSLCGKENLIRYPLGSPVHPPRQFGYNCYFREAYKAGYEPNVRILPDGFDYLFADREEADRRLIELAAGNIKEGCKERIVRNFEQFYETRPDETVRVKIESGAAVMWWNTAD